MDGTVISSILSGNRADGLQMDIDIVLREMRFKFEHIYIYHQMW